MADYTVKEAADLLNCSPVSIYRYVKSGELEAFRIGPRLRIPEASLKRFRDRPVYHVSQSFLTRVGVNLIDPTSGTFQCQSCHVTWSPDTKPGNFPKGYWKCPRGCNADLKFGRHAKEEEK